MDNKGQSLVEFAISLVILLYLLSGAVEFGIIFFQYVQLRDAAQEGGVYGSACDCDTSIIEQYVRGASSSPLNLSDTSKVFVEFSLTDKLGNPKDVSLKCEEDGLTVRVSYPHKIFMPFMPQLLGRSEILLSGVVTNTVLRPACP